MRFQRPEFRVQISAADASCHEGAKAWFDGLTTGACRELAARCLRGLILVLMLGGVATAETIDRVLAVVAGQVILLSDVIAARDLGLQTAEGAGDPVRLVLDKLIDREVERIRARFGSGAFESTLARSGIDENHVRETVRQSLRMAAYMNQRFATVGDRRTQVIDDWKAGLRRRGAVIDLYLTR